MKKIKLLTAVTAFTVMFFVAHTTLAKPKLLLKKATLFGGEIINLDWMNPVYKFFVLKNNVLYDFVSSNVKFCQSSGSRLKTNVPISGDLVDIWGSYNGTEVRYGTTYNVITASKVRDYFYLPWKASWKATVKGINAYSGSVHSIQLDAGKRGTPTIGITPDTKFLTSRKKPFDSNTLQVGDRVSVQGLWHRTQDLSSPMSLPYQYIMNIKWIKVLK